MFAIAVRRVVALVLLLCASSSVVQAQNEQGVYCSMHGFVGSCVGPSTCNVVWADHVRAAHRGDGADSYMDRVVPANLSPRGTPLSVGVRGVIFYGFIGALAGTFVESPDSNSFHAVSGALATVGVFYAAGNVFNRGGWGPIAGTVMGAAAGAALGSGIGRFQEKSFDGTPEREDERDHTAELTSTGAIVGAAIGLSLPLLTRTFRIATPTHGAGGGFEPMSSPNRVGVRWYWHSVPGR